MKKGRRYRYYTSQAIIQKRRKATHLDRIPARELEQLVYSRIQLVLSSPQEMAGVYTESALLTSDLGHLIEAAQAIAEKWSELTSQKAAELLRGMVRRIVLRASEVEIEADLEALERSLLPQDWDGCGDEGSEAQGGNHLITLKCSFRLARRSGELRLVLPDSRVDTSRLPSPLLKAIVTAHGWRERILAGEICSIEQLAAEARLNARCASRILRLAALSPSLVDDVVLYGYAGDRSLRQLMRALPLRWSEQVALFQSGPSALERHALLLDGSPPLGLTSCRQLAVNIREHWRSPRPLVEQRHEAHEIALPDRLAPAQRRGACGPGRQ